MILQRWTAGVVLGRTSTVFDDFAALDSGRRALDAHGIEEETFPARSPVPDAAAERRHEHGEPKRRGGRRERDREGRCPNQKPQDARLDVVSLVLGRDRGGRRRDSPFLAVAVPHLERLRAVAEQVVRRRWRRAAAEVRGAIGDRRRRAAAAEAQRAIGRAAAAEAQRAIARAAAEAQRAIRARLQGLQARHGNGASERERERASFYCSSTHGCAAMESAQRVARSRQAQRLLNKVPKTDTVSPRTRT